MADEAEVVENEDSFDSCTVTCTAIVGRDSNDDPIRCTNKCGKPDSPTHQILGEHYCKEHR